MGYRRPRTSPDPPADSGRSVDGTVINGIYDVAGLIGCGGAGAVYRAIHRRTGERFAIKVLERTHQDDEFTVARFRAEALIASALRHPHIVQVYDTAHLPDGRPYILMEYLEGEDLHQRLSLRGPMGIDQAAVILRQAGLALEHAHRNAIVHRDIKPSNVFLVGPPAGEVMVKLIDFGVARMRGALSRSHQTQENQVLGTPAFMSPEALLGMQSVVDERSDQYSLALVLCQMLIGVAHALPKSSPESLLTGASEMPRLLGDLPAEVPVGVRAAIKRALSWRKGERFPSILDFVEVVSPAPLAAPPGPPLPQPAQAAQPFGPLTPRSRSARSRPLILIVDDDPELRELLRVIFEMEGFVCCLRADASDVMNVARSLFPDIVLLDVMLPGKSGYKCCWEIKSQADTRHIPVLLLSGKALEADSRLGLAMKADAYIEKPFEVVSLVAQVRSQLHRSARSDLS